MSIAVHANRASDRFGGAMHARARRSLLARTALIAVLTMAGARISEARSGERLFAIPGAGGYPKLYELDTKTCNAVGYEIVEGHALLLAGLAWSGGRFWTIDHHAISVPPYEQLATGHPADRGFEVLGPIGFQIEYSGCSIDFDPVSGLLYMVADNNLYRLDSLDGQATLVAPIGPNPDGYMTLGINASGEAYTTGTGAPRLYRLDLSNGHATLLKHLGLGAGTFWDLAFSANGTLWGSYHDFGSTGAKSGVYWIDLVGLTAQKKADFANGVPYIGLCFVPAPSITTYCVAERNELGCLPAIHGTGWPSPTAASGFAIQADNVANQSLGVLIVGTRGRSERPFLGGTLCVRKPFLVSPLVPSWGSPPPAYDCSGTLWLDYNAFVASGTSNPALYQPGTTVQCQWLALDRHSSSHDRVNLTDAVEFVLEL
ncbi:MAG: hypothetical protein IT453_08055 [Planctomycetes bacterium]|nr:hypothetical protein [Planctomycetota bacterium]